VDATPLAAGHFSGVGHYTLGMVQGFDKLAEEGKLEYSLIVEAGRANKLEKYELRHCRKVIKNPLPAGAMRWLTRLKLPFNFDWLFGKGHYYFPDFITWKLSRASTATTVIHDMAFKSMPDSLDEKNLRYLERIVPMTLNRANRIIAASEFTKSEIVKYYGTDPSRITVVGAAVDTSVFYKRSQKDIDAMRQKYGLPSGKYILTLGNLDPRKNHARMLDAFASLPKEITDEHAFVLVGAGGWKNSDLYEKIADLKEQGYRIFIPEKFVEDEDRPMFFSGAELFVLMSLYEGFGMQVVEALACGSRVLISNTSSLPEAAGDAAFYADPTDTGGIADALQKLLIHREAKGLDIIERQVAKFSWRKSAEVTAKVASGTK
jgi:alpha-1,3-rhamnosyl/mannosyltransferase